MLVAGHRALIRAMALAEFRRRSSRHLVVNHSRTTHAAYVISPTKVVVNFELEWGTSQNTSRQLPPPARQTRISSWTSVAKQKKMYPFYRKKNVGSVAAEAERPPQRPSVGLQEAEAPQVIPAPNNGCPRPGWYRRGTCPERCGPGPPQRALYPSTFHNGEPAKSTLLPSKRVLHGSDVADWALVAPRAENGTVAKISN